MLVLYNSIMSVAAGVGLLLVVMLGCQTLQRKTIAAEGWSLSFAILGVILTVLGFVMSITWPYRVAGAIDGNILFGEPSIAFGLLLLAASFYIWHRRTIFVQLSSTNKDESDSAYAEIIGVLKPVSIFVFAVGLVMTACSIAWIRYRLGAAPPSEPISGRFSNDKWLESIFMGLLYGLVALGALLFPLGVSHGSHKVLKVIAVCWIISGVVFTVFGAFNFYTHVGDVVNATGGHFRY